MKVFCSEDHRLHFPQAELSEGRFVTPYESPDRVDMILRRLRARGFADIAAPRPPDMAPIRALHDAGYLAFLETGFTDWKAAGNAGDLIAANYPARRMNATRPPRHIDGKAGFYALASETAITAGTWLAALSSVASAQDAARTVAAGARAAFALCRPPGHHAARDLFGGYCFLNNAAIAAQMLREAGAARVAVLDVDFHHGNGTQDIFYDRDDVFFASIHGAPEDCFPFFLGHGDETGQGAGVGANANFPLPPGTGYDAWAQALDAALARIAAHGAEALVVSLGVDAYVGDPISAFRLQSADFTDMGARIARTGLPCVFCMEGGYAIDEIGVNTVNTLEGFCGA
jgi:acetoin utilization deacetylase AcuC-like enzyme